MEFNRAFQEECIQNAFLAEPKNQTLDQISGS